MSSVFSSFIGSLMGGLYANMQLPPDFNFDILYESLTAMNYTNNDDATSSATPVMDPEKLAADVAAKELRMEVSFVFNTAIFKVVFIRTLHLIIDITVL